MQHTAIRLIMRRAFGGGSIKILQSIFGLLVSILLARVLGVEEFGVYAFLLAVVTLIGVPVRDGMGQLILREIAQAVAARDWLLARGVLVWAAALAGIYVLVTGGMLLGVWALADDVGTPPAAVIAASGLLVFIAFTGVLAGAANGLKHVVLGLLPGGVVVPVAHASIFALLIWVFARPPVAATAMGGHALGALVALLFAGLALWRILPGELRGGREVTIRNRRWLIAVLPFAAVGGLQMMTMQLDLILLGLLGSSTEVGYYRIAAQGAMITTLGMQAINITLAPYCAELVLPGDRARLQRLLNLGSAVALGFTAAVLLVLIPFGRPLIRLAFGPEFLPAYYPLLILSAGKLAAAATGPLTIVLNMAGHERTTMVQFAMVVAVNIVLNLILITLFGAIGAAMASAVSLTWWAISRSLAARRLLGVFPFRRPG